MHRNIHYALTNVCETCFTLHENSLLWTDSVHRNVHDALTNVCENMFSPHENIVFWTQRRNELRQDIFYKQIGFYY